jgi:hypothetical protein
MSRIYMMKPADGMEGAKDAILQTVAEAGPNACPPFVIGVGIGGTFEKAALLAKKALTRSVGEPSPLPHIREMEEELGVQLLTRTNRNVRLTQEGMRLRRRAQEIVDLMDKTKDEFTHREDEIAGDIFIGCGETQIMRQLARVMIPLQKEHPGIRFHLYSANADEVTEKLDRGLLDFGLMIEPFNMKQYESIPLPDEDTES